MATVNRFSRPVSTIARWSATLAMACLCLAASSQEAPGDTAANFDERAQLEEAKQAYERRRAAAHARMPDTLYASNPTLSNSPHAAVEQDKPAGIDPEKYRQALQVAQSLIPSSTDDNAETAEEVFEREVSPIVQAQCALCHVANGVYQGDRVVFVRESDAEHLALNFQVFSDFLDDDPDGVNVILNKIRGNNHGGGEQAPAGGDKYASFERFLGLLAGRDAEQPVAWDRLFAGVTLESERSTLRRAAIVFAGRNPTAAEYADLEDIGLRQAIRNVMNDPEFHEFLIRASNDRLFTDRERGVLSRFDREPYVTYSNKRTAQCEREVNGVSDAERNSMRSWENAVQFAAVRAPLELIAYVAKNDLPYTEILTADYIMANPQAAEAYRADTEFASDDDAFEFRPSKIVAYYLNDGSRQFGERVMGCERPITYPGDLHLDYPHAGVLNSKVFMQRYPTTATNRNRARSRWTYYHFLGLDVEKSASRTTDPDALVDKHNPTYNNPACTVCHSVLDPIAGLYQNYGNEGRYRPNFGGRDALDSFYKYDPPGGADFLIEAKTHLTRQFVSARGFLSAGDNTIGLKSVRLRNWPQMGLNRLKVHDDNGRLVDSRDLFTLGDQGCGRSQNGMFILDTNCTVGVPVRAPNDGIYSVEVDAWNRNANSSDPVLLRVWVPGYVYEEGDTWYRDMRTPGFGAEAAPNADTSVQWLAQRIAEDDRFATSTVKFWWPALHGSEALSVPTQSSDRDFESRLMAAVAQDSEIRRLAAEFRRGIAGGDPYNLKDLLVEMTLSPWFRADGMTDADPVRELALLHAGAKRLLTPEELARKTLSLTGLQWGRGFRRNWMRLNERLDWLGRDYNILYGGIDSDGNTARARDMTAVMASVAKSHAVELSCPIVLRDLYLLPNGERLLFNDVESTDHPSSEFSNVFSVEGNSYSNRQTLVINGPLSAGEITVNMVFLNDYWGGSSATDRNVYVNLVRLRGANNILIDIAEPSDFVNDGCGNPNADPSYIGATCEPVVANFDIPADGTYSIEVVAWATQAGDELARLSVAIESNAKNSAGSRVIRAKLAELHHKMLGVELSTNSPEIDATYGFFVDVWNREKDSRTQRLDHAIPCRWEADRHFLDGLTDKHLVDNGYETDTDWNVAYGYLDERDPLDVRGVGKTWTVIISAMLMDPRYLHL